ncbi:MAG TPA: hypothetical protein VMB51_04580 [Solirubrobacteraceae bacterium]|nr:hypothetical protein [Solirubrobacteraceae bacterium]
MATKLGISEKEFRKIFVDADDCYRAAYSEGLARLSKTVADAARREINWLERVRAGLVAMLGFFDDEPSWARLLLLDTPATKAVVFGHRRALHGVVTGLLAMGRDEGRATDASASLPALTDELIAGGVLSVIRTSLLEGDTGKLVELAPSLMAFIVAPYLGQAAAQGELQGVSSPFAPASAPTPRTASLPVAVSASTPSSASARAHAISRAAELPIRVTRRTTLVLQAIAHTPYLNNREIAHVAGIADEGQASKLLARLERKGVIENVGVGAARGEPNAWLLTSSGRRTVELLAGGPGAATPSKSTATWGMA